MKLPSIRPRPHRFAHTAFAAIAALAAAGSLGAQNIPDRGTTFDPLADHAADTAGTTWLPGTRLVGEFARYSNGSGEHHRWNAKTGGWMEIVRVDSTWSVSIAGMMEMVADAFSDIGFNPRGIFWQEGVLAELRLGRNEAFAFGYVHRCKHDIDNLEPFLLAGRIEQSTLIYSGPTLQLLARPRTIVDGAWRIDAGGAVRNDLFVHLFDQREPHAEQPGRDLTMLADAINLSGRLDLRPRTANLGLHVSADWMLSLFGSGPGWSGRWSGLTALGSMPYVELGLDLFTPHAGVFTFFARGEWQRDGNIVPRETPARLLLFGIRAGAADVMW